MDKDKKKKTIFKIKIFLLLFVLLISFIYTIKILDKFNLKVDDLFLSLLIDNSSNLEGEGISSSIVNYVIELDFLNPVNILENNFKGLVAKPKDIDKIDKLNTSSKEEISQNSLSKDNENKPVVYIFNTHQSEKYSSKNLSVHNIKPTVLVASYMLQEELKKIGISSIVEESDVAELLRVNNWNYASSYKITRMLLEQAKKSNPSLMFYIDLHRDSVPRDKTTITIDNKIYAKVLFLLGMDNKNYQSSEKVISKMNDIVNARYPGLSKGIYKKGGSGVNGIYNQDFSSNCVLIEVGGVDNTIEEVSNTIEAIAYMLKTYMGDNSE